MTWGSSVGSACLVLACTVMAASACFVINCPRGGKRSLDSQLDSEIHATHQCMRCGPELQGQCIGPNICCGATIGCFMNSLETEACPRENDNPSPCHVDAKPCGALPKDGYCMADGLCCTDEHCTLDSRCEIPRAASLKKSAK